MNNETETREHWSNRLSFVLAAAGSAIGLGNIWRFPYITGENGGGAFVLIYLLCVAAIGLPVMICEITLGRATQKNPVGCFKALTPPASVLAHLLGSGLILTGIALLCFQAWGWGIMALILGSLVFWQSWRIVGIAGVIAGFLILSYYSIIGGWAIGYMLKSAVSRLHYSSVDAAKEAFGAFTGNIGLVTLYHLIFMGLSSSIIYSGVKKGIEKTCKMLVPFLFFLMFAIILRGITLPGARAGVSFCFTPDFSKLSTQSILIALGHSFFTLSLGMGAIITYGSYVNRNDNIFLSSVWVVALDTFFSIFACLMIFPAVFAMGFEPSEGPGLIFQVLPVVFNKLPLGQLWATCFFLLLFLAALTSAISLLEVVVSYLVDERKWSRKVASVLMGLAIFITGCFSIISMNDWQALPSLQKIILIGFGTARASFFDLIDNLTCNWMLPLGGLFICLFVGWVWGIRNAVNEIRHGSANFADVHLLALMAGLKDDPSHNSNIHVVTLASLWGIFVRFVCPIAVLVTFLHVIGVIDISKSKQHETNKEKEAVKEYVENTRQDSPTNK